MVRYINADCPCGNGRRIKIRGGDLIFGNIENLFVYPNLDINQFEDALRKTLSFWPIITGRIIVNDDEYLIECNDQSIPLTITENNQLKSWPNYPVIIDDASIVEPFIDSVIFKPEVEPLVRLKITHLIESDEYIVGISVCHMIGDADTNIRFLNDLSQIYQGLQPLLPRPIFERDLLQEEKPDFSIPLIEHLSEHAGRKENLLSSISKEYPETDPLNLSLSSKEISQIRSQIQANDQLTDHDILCAYLIRTLNQNFFENEDQYIRSIHMLINYRGVSDQVAPLGYVGNALLTTFTSQFSNPLSVLHIAKTIRESINLVRNKDLIEKWIISADVLTRQLVKEDRITFIFGSDQFVFNSNWKYDWVKLVNFGMIDRCRFHTVGLFKFYFRIFRLNPIKQDDNTWIRDETGAEIAFRIPKGQQKENFLKAWRTDVERNFFDLY